MTIVAILSLVVNIVLFVVLTTKFNRKQRPALPPKITTQDEWRNQAYTHVKESLAGTESDLEAQRERLVELEIELKHKAQKIIKDEQKLQLAKQEVVAIKSRYEERLEYVSNKQQEFTSRYKDKLLEISNFEEEGIRAELEKIIKQEVIQDLNSWKKSYISRFRKDVYTQAREMNLLAIQRSSSEVIREHTTISIPVEGEDIKGKIIGKNGRNIQWLERTLGVEVLVDKTPGYIAISGFNSIRKHIAKETIEMLLQDGRIHPARIEEIYAYAKRSVQEEIMNAGTEVCRDLGIVDFPEALVELIGRLKFRTSYGQNMLRHSLEMAKLAKLLAVDLNQEFNTLHPIDVDICVKGALLHDIGKSMDEETIPKGNHVDLGEKICERFGLDWRIRVCISSHHNEQYYDREHGFCLEAPIVDACDSLSGGRQGARSHMDEAFDKQRTELERVAGMVSGVNKAWVMYGGQELWIFFDTKKVDEADTDQIVRDLADTINQSLSTPTPIKIVGYWEDKVVHHSR